MTLEICDLYIREEQSYYLKTGCPRTFAELVDSFRKYFYAARRVDWTACP